MARILSVSYDDTLLRTRELLLQRRGHRVVSCLEFMKAMEVCTEPGFDLLVVGHSIPVEDKAEIIKCFRGQNPRAEVVALTRMGEAHMEEVDHYLNPGDPAAFIETIDRIVHPCRLHLTKQAATSVRWWSLVFFNAVRRQQWRLLTTG